MPERYSRSEGSILQANKKPEEIDKTVANDWPSLCETNTDQFFRSVSEDNILMVSQVNENECLICADKMKQDLEPYRVGARFGEEQHFTSLRCKQGTTLENGFLFES